MKRIFGAKGKKDDTPKPTLEDAMKKSEGRVDHLDAKVRLRPLQNVLFFLVGFPGGRTSDGRPLQLEGNRGDSKSPVPRKELQHSVSRSLARGFPKPCLTLVSWLVSSSSRLFPVYVRQHVRSVPAHPRVRLPSWTRSCCSTRSS